MAAIGHVFSSILKGVGLISTPKTSTLAVPPPVTRDDAAAQIQADDALRQRKGAAADIVTGATGAEAPLTGGKLILGN